MCVLYAHLPVLLGLIMTQVPSSYLAELVALDALADDGAGGGEAVAAHQVHHAGQVEQPGVEGQPLDHVAGQQQHQQHRDDDAVGDLKADCSLCSVHVKILNFDLIINVYIRFINTRKERI